MAIQDDSSVALIPSAYGTSKVYSVIPSNGNGDFTFTRSGNATRVNKGGYIETMGSNVPRLDYPLIDGVVQDCPALLLEPSRTNLISQSENINAWLNQFSPTLTQNSSISPDGSVSADKITSTHINSAKYISVTTVNSTQYNVNVFLKNIDSQRSRIEIYNAPNCILEINWTNNQPSTQSTTTFTDVSYSYYGNGWWRVSANFTATGTNNFYIYPDRINGTDSILVWGAQLEAGSYPTSYIPTSGSTATRSADVCNGSGTSAEFNGSEGVLFAEIAALADDGTNRHIGISDNTNTNRLQIFFNTHTTTQIRTLNLVGNVKYFDMTSDVTLVNAYSKVAIKYKENDFALWVNGVEVATDNSGLVWGNGVLDTLKFADGNDASPFYGKTKQLMTFKTALTDSELETLTSWDSFNAMAKGQLYSIE
jgi:hypothetical protein